MAENVEKVEKKLIGHVPHCCSIHLFDDVSDKDRHYHEMGYYCLILFHSNE